MGTTVQDSDDLGVSLDGHTRNGPFRGQLEELDSHFLGQCATVTKPFAKRGVQVVEYAHGVIPLDCSR